MITDCVGGSLSLQTNGQTVGPFTMVDNNQQLEQRRVVSFEFRTHTGSDRELRLLMLRGSPFPSQTVTVVYERTIRLGSPGLQNVSVS